MEPVSLALGILPLLSEVLKLYNATNSKLKIFRHYSRAIDRARKQFERQRQFFLNETNLVLRLANINTCEVREMVGDLDHPEWCSPDLKNDLEQCLGRNNALIVGIIEDIEYIITQWQEGMECFQCLEEQRQEGEDFKSAVKRLRKRCKIAFDKKKFDDWTNELRNLNDDLKRIRKQVIELRNPKATDLETRPTRSRLPQKFRSLGATRKACQALYEVLRITLSLKDASRYRHLIKLFLDITPSEDMQLDLVIYCICMERRLLQPGMITVHVRSESIEWTNTDLPTPPASDSSLCDIRTPKKRRVGFSGEDACVRDCPESHTDQVTAGPKAPSVDLSLSEHLCSVLAAEPKVVDEKPETMCLGHLDTCTDERLRHTFFQCCQGPCRCCDLPHGAGELMHVDDILSTPRNEELTVVDQLRLALRIASAVLKLNSTPWLSQHWSLHDLSFFQKGSDLPNSLGSLHISLELAKETTEQSTTMDVDMDNPTSAFVNSGIAHGIRNLTLYNLGVALLSIARWSKIDPYQVLHVERIASQSCPLGPRYQELTQKALHCDFGHGKDLRKPKLQEAVYNSVIEKLEDMITSLDIDGES